MEDFKKSTPKRGPGRPPIPDLPEMRTTVVRDTISQMKLLSDSGYSHSQAYRLGSRILTRTKVPTDLKKEEIKKRLEEIEITINQAYEQKQVLINSMREITEAKEAEKEIKENLEKSIIIATERMCKSWKDIYKNSTYKKYMIGGIIEILPENSISELEINNFIKNSERYPNREKINQFLKDKLKDLF